MRQKKICIYITPFSLNDKSGASRVCYANLYSLSKEFEIFYVGPDCAEDLEKFNIIGINKISNSSIIDKIMSIILKHPTPQSYTYQKQIKVPNKILTKSKFVFVESTRLNLNNHFKKIFIQLHNLERDYYRRNYSFVRSIFVGIAEKIVLRSACGIIAFHEHDKNKILKVAPNANICITGHPVIKQKIFPKKRKNKRNVILFIGNFTSKFNLVLLNQVLSHWDKNYQNIPTKLRVAGNMEASNFSSKSSNIEFYGSYNNYSNISQDVHLAIVPEVEVIGIKTRISDHIQNSTSVITTTEGAAGYEITSKYLDVLTTEKSVESVIDLAVKKVQSDTTQVDSRKFSEYIRRYLDLDSYSRKIYEFIKTSY